MRKKDLYFGYATYIVAILYCNYIFYFSVFPRSEATSLFACHYKKIPLIFKQNILFSMLFIELFTMLKSCLIYIFLNSS